MSGEGLSWVDSLKLTTSLLLGVFPKPAISAHPGPLVQQGENVTLRCHSLVMFDKFILHHENSTGHFQRHGEMLTGGYAPADFSIGPMTLASAGTYRCYGSLRRSPYEWSAPSDPVDIMITGECGHTSLLLSVSQKVWCSVQHQYWERMTGMQRCSHLGRGNKPERGGVNTEGKREQSPCHVLRRLSR